MAYMYVHVLQHAALLGFGPERSMQKQDDYMYTLHVGSALSDLDSVVTLVASGLVDQIPSHDGGVISIPAMYSKHTAELCAQGFSY